MKKIIISAILLIALVLCIVACTDQEQPKTPGSSYQTQGNTLGPYVTGAPLETTPSGIPVGEDTDEGWGTMGSLN